MYFTAAFCFFVSGVVSAVIKVVLLLVYAFAALYLVVRVVVFFDLGLCVFIYCVFVCCPYVKLVCEW